MELHEVVQFVESLRDRKLDGPTLRALHELWCQLEDNVPANERFQGPKSYASVLKLTVDLLENALEIHPLTSEEWNSLDAPSSILIGILLKFISSNADAVNTAEKVETVKKIATIFIPPCREAELLKKSMTKLNGLRILRLICWEDFDFYARKKIFGLFRDDLLSPSAKLFGRSSESQVLIERLVEMFEANADFDFQQYIMETLVRFSLTRKNWQHELRSFFKNSPEIAAETHVISIKEFDDTLREFLIRANKCFPPTCRVFSLKCVEAHADDILLKKPQDLSNLWMDLSPLTGNVQLIFACDSGSLVKITLDFDVVATIQTSVVGQSADEIKVHLKLNNPGIYVPYEPETLHISNLTVVFKNDEQFAEAEESFFVHAYADKYKSTRSPDPLKLANDDEPKQCETIVEIDELEQSLLTHDVIHSTRIAAPFPESEPRTARSAVSPVLNLYNQMEAEQPADVEGSSSATQVGIEKDGINSARHSSISHGVQCCPPSSRDDVPSRSSVTGGMFCAGITDPEPSLGIQETPSWENFIDLTEDSTWPSDKGASSSNLEMNGLVDESAAKLTYDWDVDVSEKQSYCSQMGEASAETKCDMDLSESPDVSHLDDSRSDVVDSSSDAVPSRVISEANSSTNVVVYKDHHIVQSSTDVDLDLQRCIPESLDNNAPECSYYQSESHERVFGNDKNLPSFQELSQHSDHQLPILRPAVFVVPESTKCAGLFRKNTSHSESEQSASSSFAHVNSGTTTKVEIKAPVFDLNKIDESRSPTDDDDDVYRFVDEEMEQNMGLLKHAAPPKKPSKRLLYTPGRGDLMCKDDTSIKSDQAINLPSTIIRQNVFANPSDIRSPGVRATIEENSNAKVCRKRKPPPPTEGSCPPLKRQRSSGFDCTESDSSQKTGRTGRPPARSPIPRRAKGDGVFTRGQMKQVQNQMFFSKKVKELQNLLEKPKQKKRQGFIRKKGGGTFSNGILATSIKIDPLRSAAPASPSAIDPKKPEVLSSENLIPQPPISPPVHDVDLTASSPPPPVELNEEFEYGIRTRGQTKKSREMEPNTPKKVGRHKKLTNSQTGAGFSPKSCNRSQESCSSKKVGRPKKIRTIQTDSPKRAASMSSGLGSLEGSEISPVVVGRTRNELNKAVLESPSYVTTRRSKVLHKHALETAVSDRRNNPLIEETSPSRNSVIADVSHSYIHTAGTGCKENELEAVGTSHQQNVTFDSSSSPVTFRRSQRLNQSQAMEAAVSDRKKYQLVDVKSTSLHEKGATSYSSPSYVTHSQRLNRSETPNVVPIDLTKNNLQEFPVDYSVGQTVEQCEEAAPTRRPSSLFSNSSVCNSASSHSSMDPRNPYLHQNIQVFPAHFQFALPPGDPKPGLLSEHTRLLHDLTHKVTDVFINAIRQREADPYSHANLTLDSMRTNLVTLLNKHIEWSKKVNRCAEIIQEMNMEMSTSFQVAIDMIEKINDIHRESLKSANLRQNDPRTYSHVRQDVWKIFQEHLKKP